MPSFGELRIRGQDDGFPILPAFPTQPSVSNLLSDPPGPTVVQDPGGPTPSNITLPPLGRVDHRPSGQASGSGSGSGFGGGQVSAWPRPPYRDGK
jgi:hypothetical protein